MIANLKRYAMRNIKLISMVGKTFQRPSDPTSPGPRTMQTWLVVRHLDKDVYECRLIDHNRDIMLTGNPQIRTFREAEINKHLNNQ
jgi:hypothetical protein